VNHPSPDPRFVTRRTILARTVSALSSAALVSSGCAPAVREWHATLHPYRRYQQRESTKGVLTARFFGTTSVLFEDATTKILSDGFVTRPGLLQVAFGRLQSNEQRVKETLARLGLDSLDAVFTGHSHYDHAMDAPLIAKKTGAVLIGSKSTQNIALGAGLPEGRTRVVANGDSHRCGSFELTFIESAHSRPEPWEGTIGAPLVTPAPARKWKTGGTWSVLIRHHDATTDTARTLLVHGSANHCGDALRGRRAEVVYLGIGGLGLQSDTFVDEYWQTVVRTVHAKRVILVHWDDFFAPLEPLRPFPPLLAFANAIRRIRRHARADDVQVFLPVPWRRVDPFAGLSRPKDVA